MGIKTLTPRRFTLILIVVLLALSFSTIAAAQEAHVDVLTVKGTINPVLVDYIERGIEQAEDRGARALIIQLDTPGGLDTAMRDIVQLIVSARVPVVVYVGPSGARAASAGVFITLAAHVAVMAPSTTIGAAHPVQLGEQGEQQMSEAMEEKVVNDSAAYIRSLAEGRKRNLEWAEQAVRESVSATESEALELNVIDIIAADIPELLQKLNGRQVTLLDGRQVTIQTRDAAIVDNEMRGIERFLYTLADPNIAYILLSLAMLGIITEIYSPGLIFPGALGGICLLLAFFSLGVLPVNYAGIGLIILAFGLFVGEILTPGIGFFTVGGVISLVTGSLILFRGAAPVFRVNPWLIGTVTIIITSLFVFVINRAVSIHRKQATTGREELIGKTAVVKVALDPAGTVFYKGERWSAISEEGTIKAGAEVVIDKVDGLILHVKKK